MATKFKTDADFINSVLLEFGKQVIAQRRRNVRNEKAVNTEELLRSYDYEVQKAGIEQVGVALIAFEEHGRFLDMRRIDRKGKLINVDSVITWLKNGGLSKFKTLPSDAQGRTAANYRPLLNDLAWGVVKSVQKRGGYSRKKRRKLQSGFEASLDVLITELRDGYQDRTIEQIKESLIKKIN